MKVLVTFGILPLILIMSNDFSKKRIKNQIENQVNLNQYCGKWYEIYRFPHRFEKGLVNVTATYTLLSENKIQVVNEGFFNTPNGKHKVANGIAKIPNPEIPGRLRVSFFRPFYADYLILKLDTLHYRWVLVGSSSPNYLWILSRQPTLEPEISEQLKQYAKSLGYDLSKLEKVIQEW